MIQPDEIPQVPGDIDVVATHGQTLKTKGKAFADSGLDVHTTWQGLATYYSAPEAATLFAATTPVKTKSADVGADIGSVGGALVAYADAVRPIQARLRSLQADARAFRADVRGDDDWNKDEDKVDQHNDLLSGVNAEVAAWQDAQRTCANTINALYGGTQYVRDDGNRDPHEYGYSADQLDNADALPWGKSEERDKPWYEDAVDVVASVGKGFFVDGLWGDLRGLGNLVGFGGVDGLKASWSGVYRLAILAVPPLYFTALALNQFTDLPGIPKGTLFGDYKDMTKGLLAWDTWKEDPARAFGNVTWSVVSVVAGTKGTGSALKVGEVGALTERVVGTVRVSGDVGKVEIPGLKAAEDAASHLDDGALDLAPVNSPATPKIDAPIVGAPRHEPGYGSTDAPPHDAPKAEASSSEGQLVTAGADDTNTPPDSAHHPDATDGSSSTARSSETGTPAPPERGATPDWTADGTLPRRPDDPLLPHPELTAVEKNALDERLNGLEAKYREDYSQMEYDPDKGSIKPASQDEARVALDLRERGLLPTDIQRPPTAERGDYYSPSANTYYELKGVHSDWPPFNTQRDRSMPFPGAYDPANSGRLVDNIELQLLRGRTPILDVRNANQSAIDDLRRIASQRGWEGRIAWYP